ncbi:MAG: DUF5060 domain-containing protein [Verrucomicrobiota bacterium]
MTIRIIACAALSTSAMAEDLSKPIAPPDLVFEEKDGLVAIEAEHFIKQEKTDKRAWYLTTKDKAAGLEPDPDPSHIAGVSGGAYLEILPDTRRTHGDKLIVLENFSPEPGHMAILSYKVHFNTPGKYWLWARVHSTGSEDNGLHFGINGTWPPSAQRWQTVEKRKWHWRSAQRTAKQHSGVPGILTLDVPSAGEHTIQVCMREDGIELDKILLVNRKDYQVEGLGPDPVVKSGKLPAAFEMVKADPAEAAKPALQPKAAPVRLAIKATELDLGDGGYYLDQGRWLAINPEGRKSAKVQTASPFPDGRYDITLEAVGESDGSSSYAVSVNGSKIGEHTCPLATETYETGPKFHGTFKNVAVASGDVIEVSSKVASSDGKEWSRARWAALSFKPADDATRKAVANYRKPAPKPKKPAGPPLQQPRQPDGDGSVAISGDLKQWHKVTLTLDGPYAHELDRQPNPFTDLALWVRFRHESGKPDYLVPGYFAADGNAAESSAVSGTKWRAHLSPDKPGKWEYTVNFRSGGHAAFRSSEGQVVAPFDGKSGHFMIAASDKAAPDFRGRGRLAYVGKHHLQFQGDMSYFLKAGPDAPETAMAFADFDDTRAIKKNVPVKSWAPHVKDWKEGDPTWKGGKGKGLIGGLNYLAAKGMNAWSFLPYNVGGDGANIWPFTGPRDKFHYDCSKLDQWGIVFDHATSKGIYLHFKMQENEMDDNRLGHQLKQGNVPASLDGGKLGPERMLYCRELIARFGHALALNWNIGEETTQTTEEIRDMIEYIRGIDPYQHHVVIHTFPQQQDKVYKPLLGFKGLTGASLQNRWDQVHRLTVKWIKASAEAGHPWVAANDEQGSADTGVPPDPDYPGKTKTGHTIHDIRRMTLWGNLMAGGAGVEYYFGYKLAENDLLAEDWRSRDQSWDFARIALEFFTGNDIPFHEMSCRDELIGNPKHDNSKFCFAKEGEIYLVYLPKGGETSIELPEGKKLGLTWFNPRSGEMGETSDFNGDKLTAPDGEDWLAVLR